MMVGHSGLTCRACRKGGCMQYLFEMPQTDVHLYFFGISEIMKIKKILESPTYSTWISLGSKYFTFLLITPLLLTKFSAEEIALWYLFNTVIAFSGMFDLGFAQTLIRYSSFVSAGIQNINDLSKKEAPCLGKSEYDINWNFFSDLLDVYRRIYLFLMVIAFIVLAFFITLLINKTIVESGNIIENWISWTITIIGVCIALYGKRYDSILRGMNFISLINKYETLLNLIQGMLYVVVFFTRPKLIFLVIVLQFFTILLPLLKKILINIYIPEIRSVSRSQIGFNRDIFFICWEPTWKTGIMMFGTQGINYLAGIILSNFVRPELLASYLFSQRILQVCNQFSWAPFYSKIPLYNKLRIAGEIEKLKKSVLTDINRSLFVLVSLVCVVGLLVYPALNMIDSNIVFVEPLLWVLLVVSVFVDRIQAMHGQVYMTTNDIKFYISTLMSGGLYIALLLLTIKSFGVYSIPIVFIVSNISINVWFNIKYSLQSLGVQLKEYLLVFFYQPIAFLGIFCVIMCIGSGIW